MTDLRQAAQRLVDRIDRDGASPLDWSEYNALRTALEQQAEPGQWIELTDEKGRPMTYWGGKALQQAEPFSPEAINTTQTAWKMGYEAAKAERKPLTASEILNMMPSAIPAEYDGPLMEFARAIEAAHNIKEQP